jgi:hypothetical protein
MVGAPGQALPRPVGEGLGTAWLTPISRSPSTRSAGSASCRRRWTNPTPEPPGAACWSCWRTCGGGRTRRCRRWCSPRASGRTRGWRRCWRRSVSSPRLARHGSCAQKRPTGSCPPTGNGSPRVRRAPRKRGVLVGHSPAGHQRRTSGPPAADQREHQRQTSSYSQQPTANSERKSLRARLPPTRGKVETPPTGPSSNACSPCSSKRGGSPTTHRPRGPATGRLWGTLRKRHDAAEIIRRWGIGLSASYKARCDTFVDLEARWNALTAPEAQGGAQGPQKRPDPNGGIITHVDPLDDPAALAEATRRQEEWLNGK